jgi:tripartite-type tricarboxylate transporter receptor subunit TctC
LLAVLSAKRADAAPDVPTALEQGVKVVIDGWHLLAAPSGTPAAIVDRLNAALNEVLKDEAVREKLLKAGVRPAGSTPAEANAAVAREYEAWGEVASKAGIEPN